MIALALAKLADVPSVDIFNALVLFGLIANILLNFDSESLQLLALLSVAFILVQWVIKAAALRFAKSQLTDPAAQNKLQTSCWHLVMRLVFVSAEAAILFAPGWPGADGNWFNDTRNLWIPRPSEQAISPVVKLFYLAQMAVWINAGVDEAFFRALSKDHVAMLLHHTSTLALVSFSYMVGAHRVGVLVVACHELSDIPADLLKIANYLQIPIVTEVLFITVMVVWAYYRLYYFPCHLIYSCLVEARRELDAGAGLMANGDWSLVKSLAASPFTLANLPGWGAMVFGLCILVCLHLFWYSLFVRILVRLINGEGAKGAAQSEYDGIKQGTDRNRDGKESVMSAFTRCAVRFLRFAVRMIGVLVVAPVVILVTGFVVTPPCQSWYAARFGADDEILAQRAAVVGLDMLPGDIPPIRTLFQLPEPGTEVDAAAQARQRAFLRYYGFVHFRGALREDEVATMTAERDRIERKLIASNTTQIMGVPIFRGMCADGTPLGCLHRIPFSTQHSHKIRDIVHHKRFHPISALLTDDFWQNQQDTQEGKAATQTCKADENENEDNCNAPPTPAGKLLGLRIGDREKDGVVLNSYAHPAQTPGQELLWSRDKLGWHNDALRDIAYGRMPQPMLNFGIHLDTVDPAQGDAALCLIPGTHRQSFGGFAFRFVPFLDNSDDESGVCIATTAGDVTVHDGRLWHRVQSATKSGIASLRRSAFVPYLTSHQPYEPKHEHSPMPFYHYFGIALRKLKGGA